MKQDTTTAPSCLQLMPCTLLTLLISCSAAVRWPCMVPLPSLGVSCKPMLVHRPSCPLPPLPMMALRHYALAPWLPIVPQIGCHPTACTDSRWQLIAAVGHYTSV